MTNKVKIILEDGIELIMDKEMDNKKLMTAIGMMVQMLAIAEKDGINKMTKEKFKSMMNMYIDIVWDYKNKRELSI